jgi:anaerobic magnesium-protoporphyrin IX monomethyl ester cyclase
MNKKTNKSDKDKNNHAKSISQINNSNDSKLDCLLIYPPMTYGTKPKYALPQLGLMYIASYLKKQGVSVNVMDAEGEGLSLKSLLNRIKNKQPKLLGLYVMTPQIPVVSAIIAAVKKEFPDLNLVIGGPHISATMLELLKLNPLVDYAIYGEGEKAFLNLFNTLKLKKDIKTVENLIYKDPKHKNKYIINPKTKLITNLDELPFPDLRLVQNYRGINYKVPYLNYPLAISMIATRGCPYRCTFCDQHITHGRVARIRSVENVISEIKFNMKLFKAKGFIFKDSTFSLDKDWAKEFCSRIIKNKIKIKWVCNTRVDKLDEKLLRLMKKSGCELISFGVESGNQEILNTLKKGTTLPMIRKTFKLCKKVGIKTHGSFMIGNPGETLRTAERTIRFAQILDPEFVCFSVTTLYPGTEIYDYAVNKGLLKDPKWYLKQQMFEGSETFLFNPLQEGKIEFNFNTNDVVRQAWRRFYFRPKYILKMMYRIITEPFYFKQIWESVPSLFNWTFRKKV